LQSQTDTAVVRGAIVDPTHTKHVRRLLHRDPATGEAPTLVERPRRWVAFDIDDVARPAHVDVADIAACGEVAVARLPDAFRDAACVIQATSSHAIKPGIRLRLWHWLERPVGGAELKYWMRDGRPGRVQTGAIGLCRAASICGRCRCDPLRRAWRGGVPSVPVPLAHALQPPPR
jgi:hypothetical protein